MLLVMQKKCFIFAYFIIIRKQIQMIDNVA
jgi:hypothetical protein